MIKHLLKRVVDWMESKRRHRAISRRLDLVRMTWEESLLQDPDYPMVLWDLQRSTLDPQRRSKAKP